MEQRIVIYTAITGGKDLPRTDIQCFTEYDKFIKKWGYNPHVRNPWKNMDIRNA